MFFPIRLSHPPPTPKNPNQKNNDEIETIVSKPSLFRVLPHLFTPFAFFVITLTFHNNQVLYILEPVQNLTASIRKNGLIG